MSGVVCSTLLADGLGDEVSAALDVLELVGALGHGVGWGSSVDVFSVYNEGLGVGLLPDPLLGGDIQISLILVPSGADSAVVEACGAVLVLNN